jgi:hypothetical protein
MNLTFECPDCERKLSPLLGAYRYATDIVHRTCRGCGRRWQIKVQPVGNVGIGFAHMLHFKPVPIKRSQENFKAVATEVRR